MLALLWISCKSQNSSLLKPHWIKQGWAWSYSVKVKFLSLGVSGFECTLRTHCGGEGGQRIFWWSVWGHWIEKLTVCTENPDQSSQAQQPNRDWSTAPARQPRSELPCLWWVDYGQPISDGERTKGTPKYPLCLWQVPPAQRSLPGVEGRKPALPLASGFKKLEQVPSELHFVGPNKEVHWLSPCAQTVEYISQRGFWGYCRMTPSISSQ